jgi:hypothetical protein
VLSKYLGYDIAAGVSKKIRNYKKDTNTAELIPYDVLEMMEDLVVYSNNEAKLKCFCSKPDYYYRHNLISLLIHLNDYHKMTFTQIGNWLENIVGFSVIILISKQRLLVTKIVKNQCKKHVLNVANTLNVLNDNAFIWEHIANQINLSKIACVIIVC